MTLAEVAKIIGIIKARYPRAEWSVSDELTVEAWHMSLGDLPREDVIQALRHLFSQSPWPPDPVDVRSWIMAESGVAPEAGEAWRIAQGAIGAYYPGHTFTYEMPDVVRQTLKAIGGIHNLKMSERPEEDRKAFMQAYPIYRKRLMSEPGMGGASALGDGRPEAIGAGQTGDTVIAVDGRTWSHE